MNKTPRLICAREAAPMRISGTAMAIVSTTAWVGMGIGSYQAGFFYDLNGTYVLSYANAAATGVINLLVVFALAWYRWSRSSASAQHSQLCVFAGGTLEQAARQSVEARRLASG